MVYGFRHRRTRLLCSAGMVDIPRRSTLEPGAKYCLRDDLYPRTPNTQYLSSSCISFAIQRLICYTKALLINKLYNHCASFCSGQGVANGGVPERYVPFATPRPRTKTGATQGAPSLLPFRCVPVEGTYASYARFDRALRIRQNRPRGCKVYLLAAPKMQIQFHDRKDHAWKQKSGPSWKNCAPC